MLTQNDIVEIDSKGNQTKVIKLVRELFHNAELKANCLILLAVTKLLQADGITGSEVLISPPLYSK